MVKAENDMARLVLVGDGPLRASLEEEAERRGLSGHVIFTGGIDHSEVPVAASALDLLVAPYPTMDQFYFSPLKVYEYMAAGKPIVASRIGQISDILEDRRTALLVTPGDASAVATAILRLWADRQFAEQLGHAARLEVQAHHSWSHRIAAWQEQLAKLQECRATEETVT